MWYWDEPRQCSHWLEDRPKGSIWFPDLARYRVSMFRGSKKNIWLPSKRIRKFRSNVLNCSWIIAKCRLSRCHLGLNCIQGSQFVFYKFFIRVSGKFGHKVRSDILVVRTPERRRIFDSFTWVSTFNLVFQGKVWWGHTVQCCRSGSAIRSKGGLVSVQEKPLIRAAGTLKDSVEGTSVFSNMMAAISTFVNTAPRIHYCAAYVAYR